MADDATDRATGDRELATLRDALAAEHAAVWGYGVVGAALDADARTASVAAEEAHRDVRDRVAGVLADRKADPVAAEGAYALPFPVLSAVDAAALAVTLEDGVAGAWVRVLDGAAERGTRELAVEVLAAAEQRAVGWRIEAGRTPVTRALPGLAAD